MEFGSSVMNMIVYGVISRLEAIEKPWIRKMSDEYFDLEVEIIRECIQFLEDRGANVEWAEKRLDEAVRKRTAGPDPQPAA